MKIKSFSFNFKGRNSRDFGIIANSYDYLLPEKRERKQQIPFRHGSHDFSKGGRKYYNERSLRLRCIWMSAVLKNITRSDIREISYWLSQEGKIVLDIEPDKYYIGEIYDRNELISHYDYAQERAEDGSVETTDGEFEITFVCEPFAYRDVAIQSLHDGANKIDYKGTAETPCTIILRNNNSFSVQNVHIVASRRKI